MDELRQIDIIPGSSFNIGGTQFLLGNLIGEGGFGCVYKASTINKEFAVKVTKMWTMVPEERVQYSKRIKQEFEIGKAIDSQFVVRNYDLEFIQGNPFLVMELCSNGSLRELVPAKISIESCIPLVEKIACGLNDLHSEGVIHRDIKPENILLDKNNDPKLADFGISASIRKRLTVANFMGYAKQVFATVVYSAPEQYDPKRAMKVMGPTNDIYSLGVLLYELLTGGELPFGSFDDFESNMIDFENRKKKEDWDRKTLQRFVSKHDKHFKAIEKCIKYNPSERFQTMEEVISFLGIERSSNSSKSDRRYTVGDIWRLRVQTGDESGRIYNLTNLLKSKKLKRDSSALVLTLGWFDDYNPFDNDIGIAENFSQYVSRSHCMLIPTRDYGWKVVDGQPDATVSGGRKPSTNGTFVNGYRVSNEGAFINNGDILTIGETTFKVIVE